MNEAQETFYYLCVSLATGLLIGIERGWKRREAEEGERVAGVRTYGLIGLLGGCAALIAQYLGPWSLGLIFIGTAGALTAVYVVNLWRGDDVGITSLVSGFLTFVFGALAGLGEVAVAASFAVLTTLILSYKPVLHHWVNALNAEELRAGIKLLLISVVLLPILPNQGYGPWQALNPYEIWWMVVLIATISFVGYFAIKIGGTRAGIFFTGLFGGLASSTALTLHFARMSHSVSTLTPALATGILLACGTMYPRMLMVSSIIQPNMFKLLLAPSLVMAILTYFPAFFYWRKNTNHKSEDVSPLKNPLEIKTALSFGLLLVLVMLLGTLLKNWFGEVGMLALAAASGIADVDAITLSLARMSLDDLDIRIAVTGIVIAATVNSLVKSFMATFIGGRKIGLLVGLPLTIGAVGGLISVWLLVW